MAGTEARSRSEELIFGLVAPLGSDLDFVGGELSRALAKYGYQTKSISISQFLHERCNVWSGEVSPYRDKYIEDHQNAGNAFREDMKRADAAALGAIAAIRQQRTSKLGRMAFVVRQFKTKAEVQLFRSIYGDRFVLIGVSAHIDKRIEALSRSIAISRGSDDNAWTKFQPDATKRIRVDESEEKIYGQNVRDTFPLSDLFIELDVSDHRRRAPALEERFRDDLGRFLELLFGKPDVPPTTEEFLMFQARAIALRSADRSRQVGAVIASWDGSVVSVGRNDDPLVGGGVFGGSLAYEEDPGSALKRLAITEVLKELDDWLDPKVKEMPSGNRIQEAMKKLKDTQFMGLGEFGRMVHAELAAITDAAMRGVGTRGQVMFCTTFPCQNCAKHIMAAGIRVVVYLEPYPKSLIDQMYKDETQQIAMLALSSEELRKRVEEKPIKLLLCTYIGVAPRRYGSLFAMPKRKNEDGSKIAWEKATATPRIDPALAAEEYLAWEEEAVNALAGYVH